MGCTAGTKEYVHDISVQNKTLKVKLLDTAGQCRSPLLVGATELDFRSQRGL
jgi:hypothetical protein